MSLNDFEVVQDAARLLRESAPNVADTLERVAARLQSDAKRYAESEKLQDIGRNAYESIAEMVAALECDYDRLEELRNARDDKHCADPAETRLGDDEREELAELEQAAGDCESREDAEQRIHEDPLSIEISGTWTIDCASEPRWWADAHKLRAEILLGTGGPATRIVCELDEHMQPHRAWIQAQDWFLPWTDYVGGSGDTLLTYCQQFYFGEG